MLLPLESMEKVLEFGLGNEPSPRLECVPALRRALSRSMSSSMSASITSDGSQSIGGRWSGISLDDRGDPFTAEGVGGRE